MNRISRRPITIPLKTAKITNLVLLIIILSGDVELNPGPTNKSIFPCGLCEIPVTWNCQGVCCDACNIWHHKSCIELCTQDYELLNRPNVQWLCCKCESINVNTFTFRSYEIESSNIYDAITNLDLTLDSIKYAFSPLRTSPKSNISISSNTNLETQSSKNLKSRTDSNPYDVPPKKNLRIMTVNCRSIKEKKRGVPCSSPLPKTRYGMWF
ncbi:hypothetical protein ACJMK2_034425 [Sinanodonta woodiana]|uniref:PHD-type domain-containing protein n=1 Tax=Sinanodonta woodiana TaxID=1069815 RepID=A0ABD3WSV2_SINWO